MAIVTEYDWESNTLTHHTGEHAVRQLWRDAVQAVAENAKAALPEANGRIEKATQIVLAGDITFLPEGKAKVASQSNGTTEYAVCNGTCECPDYPRAPQGWCKHRLSVAIHQRASQRVEKALAHQDTAQDPTPAQPAHGVPAQYVVMIQGRPFVQYAGLLALAHEQGLVKLEARFISVTSDLALAEATAAFASGKQFTEAADATPNNVGAKVKLHYARMALTRSKARVLRDALNINLCSVEELAEA